MTESELVPLREAAARFNVHPATLWRLHREGKLRTFKRLGERKTLVRMRDVAILARTQETTDLDAQMLEQDAVELERDLTEQESAK